MANKKNIEKIRKVYEVITRGYPVTLKEVAKELHINVATVRSARDFLMSERYIRVRRFDTRGAVCYEATDDTWFNVWGEVTSIRNYDFAQVVEINGYGFDLDGNEYPKHWEISFDNCILKSIADYVKSIPDEVPFF